MLLPQCIPTVIVSLMLVWKLPQSLSMMMMMICLSMTFSMVVRNVSAPLHLSGTPAKSLKLATDVANPGHMASAQG